MKRKRIKQKSIENEAVNRTLLRNQCRRLFKGIPILVLKGLLETYNTTVTLKLIDLKEYKIFVLFGENVGCRK